jgi:hypothetical protein
LQSDVAGQEIGIPVRLAGEHGTVIARREKLWHFFVEPGVGGDDHRHGGGSDLGDVPRVDAPRQLRLRRFGHDEQKTRGASVRGRRAPFHMIVELAQQLDRDRAICELVVGSSSLEQVADIAHAAQAPHAAASRWSWTNGSEAFMPPSAS